MEKLFFNPDKIAVKLNELKLIPMCPVAEKYRHLWNNIKVKYINGPNL